MALRAFFIFIAVALILFWLFGAESVAKVSVTGDSINIDSGARKLQFTPGPEEEFSGRVVQLDQPDKVSKGLGASFNLSLLSEGDYTDYKSLSAAGRCPASFMNQHAQMLLLVVPYQSEQRVITRLGLKEGDAISFTASALTFKSGSYHGIKIENFPISGAFLLLVKNSPQLSSISLR